MSIIFAEKGGSTAGSGSHERAQSIETPAVDLIGVNKGKGAADPVTTTLFQEPIDAEPISQVLPTPPTSPVKTMNPPPVQ